MSRTCALCKTQTVEYDTISGSFACTICGTVTSDNNMTSELTFAENASGSTSVVGQFVPRDGISGGSGASREMTLMNARRKIQQVVSTLGHNTGTQPTGPLLDTAHRLYSQALTAGFARGRKANYVICACIYIACIRGQEPFLLIDLAEATETNVFELGSASAALARSLGLVIAPNDPSIYIGRYANTLNFQEKTHAITMDALKILQLMQRDWLQTGRRPNGLCAACILLSARAHGHYLDLEQVALAVRISSNTVQERLAELSNTQSASVHLDQLHDTLTDESSRWDNDPPSFQRAVIQRSRTQAWRRLLSENSALREVLLHNCEMGSTHSDEDILLLSECNLSRIIQRVYFQVRNVNRFIKAKATPAEIKSMDSTTMARLLSSSGLGLFKGTSSSIDSLTLTFDQFKDAMRAQSQSQSQAQTEGLLTDESTPSLSQPSVASTALVVPSTTMTVTDSQPHQIRVTSPAEPLLLEGMRPDKDIQRVKQALLMLSMQQQLSAQSGAGHPSSSSVPPANSSDEKQLVTLPSSDGTASPATICLSDDINQLLDTSVIEVMSDLMGSKTHSLLASTTSSIANKIQDKMSTTPIFPDDIDANGYIGNIFNNPILLSHYYYKPDQVQEQELRDELDHAIVIASMEIDLFKDELENQGLEDIYDDEIDSFILSPEEQSIREAMFEATLQRTQGVIRQMKVHTSEMGEGRKRARRIKYQEEEETRTIDWSQLNDIGDILGVASPPEPVQDDPKPAADTASSLVSGPAYSDIDESAVTSGTDHLGGRRRRGVQVGPRSAGRR